jgi:hypothetical protein
VANAGTWVVTRSSGGPASFAYTSAFALTGPGSTSTQKAALLLFDTPATTYPCEAFVLVQNASAALLNKPVAGSMGLRLSVNGSDLYIDNVGDGLPAPKVTFTAKSLALGGLLSGKISGTLYNRSSSVVKKATLTGATFSGVKVVGAL